MGIKERVTARVVDLFSIAKDRYKTRKSMKRSGLFGPGSISWEVLGDVSSLLAESGLC